MLLSAAPLTPDASFLSLQQALAGRYSIERELGRGGMGVVYLAHELRLDRLVAIKLLPPTLAADEATRERFLNEARTAARLAHPHIVPIHAVDTVEGHVFYVMTFVDGETLSERVARRGPLSPREAARLLREVAWALAHAHAQGIVHRDIKPDNILFDRESGRAIVADFGIAAAIGPNRDGVAGTPPFMSPEQILGEPLDARSDLYGVGATAFFALSGRAPFEGSDVSVMTRHLNDPAPSLASVGITVPRYLSQLVAQCLAKAAAERPRDASQVAERLERGLATRRDLPAMLRAFVKRDGRADGIGTVLSVAAGLGAGLAASSVFGIEAFVAGIWVVWPLAAGGFVVRVARRLVQGGFTHADVVAAFESEVESTREERQHAPRVWLARLEPVVATIARGSIGAYICTLVGALMRTQDSTDSGTILALSFDLGVLGWCMGVAWGMVAVAQREDVLFWQRVWSGRVGQVAFAVARRISRRTGSARVMTHRATELSLSLAAEQLLEALPADVRRTLHMVPQLLQQLTSSSAAIKQRLVHVDDLLMATTDDEDIARLRAARSDLAMQLEASVGALEQLRLGLLRLHAGTSSVDGMTTQLAETEAVMREVDRVLDARQEVEDIFADVQMTQPFDRTTVTLRLDSEHA